MTGIFGVIKAVMTFVWLLFLVDQFGRRNLLLVGAVTGSICMWVIGAYICVVKPEDNPSSSLNGGGIAAIFFFYLWTAVYTPTWNGTPWVINSVSHCLLPPSIKPFPNKLLGILRSQFPFPGSGRHDRKQLAL